MQYTFAQVCDRLSGYTHAYGVTDVGVAVNKAVQALSGLNGWECLRKVLRFTSATPRFALPQGCAGLVRACVNGHPATMRGQDFQFIHSGPGDLSKPPRGFERVPFSNVVDLGTEPVMIVPAKPFKLMAFADGTGEPYLTVKGLDTDGDLVSINLPIQTKPVYDKTTGLLTSGVEPEDATPYDQEFDSVSSVVVDPCALKYVTLYAKDVESGGVNEIAVYHPAVSAPSFRHYQITCVPPDRPVDLLAEVRIDPLPLVDPTDILPLPSIEPVEYMIMYDWKMQSSEIDAARKYKEEAANWLKAQEVTDGTVQTELVVNGTIMGSLGEMSMDGINI